jgi:hypothetical protein
MRRFTPPSDRRAEHPGREFFLTETDPSRTQPPSRPSPSSPTVPASASTAAPPRSGAALLPRWSRRRLETRRSTRGLEACRSAAHVRQHHSARRCTDDILERPSGRLKRVGTLRLSRSRFNGTGSFRVEDSQRLDNSLGESWRRAVRARLGTCGLARFRALGERALGAGQLGTG